MTHFNVTLNKKEEKKKKERKLSNSNIKLNDDRCY